MPQTPMTKQYIEEIKNGWRRFDNEDIHEYTEDILIAFAQRGDFFIHRLPKKLMTDTVLSSVAELDKTNQCMKYISKDSSPNYREIATKAVASSYGNLTYVSKDVIDADFIRDAVSRGANSLCGFFDHYSDLVHQTYSTSELEEILCANSIARNQVVGGVLRGTIETSLITDAFIQQSLLVCKSLVSFIRRTDKKHLALDLIDQGEWPEEYLDEKPSDLKDAVKRMMKAKSSSVQSWQMAYAMTFGIAEVVKEMKTPSRMELLQEIYPREEILPHLSKRRGSKIKGEWLEDELGL